MDYVEKLAVQLAQGPVCMIGSVDEKGFPQIRAMLRPRAREGIKVIYFSTNKPTNKVKHFKKNEKACVYFFDGAAFQGALLLGRMEVLESRQYKEKLWQAGDELYYPGGVGDEDYCVLRFTAQSARVYSGFQSTEFEIT